MFVFQRDYVAAGGKGYPAGSELPDSILSDMQIASLTRDGILLEVIEKSVLFEQVDVVVDVEEALDPVERLDPERKPRKRVK